MKKKILLMPLAVSLLLVGCGGNQSRNDNNNEQNNNEETKKDYNIVEFNLNYGDEKNVYQNLVVKEGEKLTSPSKPYRQDYVFDGWYLEKECTEEFAKFGETVDSDFTLYAKWTEYESLTNVEKIDFFLDTIKALEGNVKQTSVDTSEEILFFMPVEFNAQMVYETEYTRYKDIVVSVDDLPELPQLWPQKGDKLMIGLSIDAKDRMWGKLATPEMFQTISGMAKKNMQNKNVTATVYRLKLVGTFVITDDYYLGFIHPSEREVEPRLGEVVKARVIGVKDDGTLNLSTRPRAYEAISDDSQMILMALQHTSAKQLPFTDKSSPDEIKAYFGISKGQFKRAVGHLMKAGLVKQADGFLILNEN